MEIRIRVGETNKRNLLGINEAFTYDSRDTPKRASRLSLPHSKSSVGPTNGSAYRDMFDQMCL